MELFVSPAKVVLYDNRTVQPITVTASSANTLATGVAVVITNEVTACDEAFSTVNSCVSPDDLSVLVNIESSRNDGQAIKFSAVAAVVTICVIFALVHLYNEKKRRQADLLWQVQPSELKFSSTPPEVIGRGTFVRALLARLSFVVDSLWSNCISPLTLLALSRVWSC